MYHITSKHDDFNKEYNIQRNELPYLGFIPVIFDTIMQIHVILQSIYHIK